MRETVTRSRYLAKIKINGFAMISFLVNVDTVISPFTLIKIPLENLEYKLTKGILILIQLVYIEEIRFEETIPRTRHNQDNSLSRERTNHLIQNQIANIPQLHKFASP